MTYNQENIDLVNDLFDMGCSSFPLPSKGKDFGFGENLKGENDGNNVLWIKSWVFEKIKPWSGWPEYRDSWWEGKIPVPCFPSKSPTFQEPQVSIALNLPSEMKGFPAPRQRGIISKEEVIDTYELIIQKIIFYWSEQ